MKAQLTALAAAFLFAVPVAAQSTTERQIDSYLNAFDRAGHLSGTVLIGRGEEIIFQKSYGRLDYSAAAVNTPATLFPVASLTKPMTGIIARTLAARGVLRLEDSIARWLPDFPDAARITVAHLLGHRSGIPHRVTRTQDEQTGQTAASMVELVSRAPRAFSPGAQRLYSSAGYSVLARVLELASAKSYATILHEIVLDPAGAAGAFDATEPVLAGRPIPRGHFWTPGALHTAPVKDLSFLVGAGSVYATPHDLFRVTRRVVNGAFGAAAAGARSENGTILWTGFSNGYRAFVDYNPATDITIVFVANLLTGAADWMLRDLPLILAGQTVAEPHVPTPVPVDLPPARRAQIQGIYRNFGAEQPLTFASPSLALLNGEYPLIATAPDRFFGPLDYSVLTVVSDSAGNVAGLRFGTEGTEVHLPRVTGR